LAQYQVTESYTGTSQSCERALLIVSQLPSAHCRALKVLGCISSSLNIWVIMVCGWVTGLTERNGILQAGLL